jgi:hypothetical protein
MQQVPNANLAGLHAYGRGIHMWEVVSHSAHPL